MTKINYEIKVSGDKIVKVVKGYKAFEKFGFLFGVHKEENLWNTTELSTGYATSKGYNTMLQAIQETEKFLDKVGIELVESQVAKVSNYLRKA